MAATGLAAQQIQIAALAVLGLCGTLALLHYGSGFLIPLVIAAMLTSLITSAIVRLESLGLPSWLAYALSIGVVFLSVYLIGMLVADQVEVVSATLPAYAERFDATLAALSSLIGTEGVEQIKQSIARTDFSKPLTTIADGAGTLFGNMGLLIIYSAFLLAERGQMTAKFGRLFPDPEKGAEMQQLLGSIGLSIRRYLWIKTIVSILTGSLCYLALKYHGVDFAAIFGVLIFLLNFIPTFGSIIAVLIPTALALVQFDTITPVISVAAMMGAVQFVVGNLIEPRFTGKSLNLSPFVVLVSLTFWSTVWGVVGAFLSVPIAATTLIVCRNIETLRWVAIMMSADGRPEASEETSEDPRPAPAATKSRPANRKHEDAALREMRRLQEELARIQHPDAHDPEPKT